MQKRHQHEKERRFAASAVMFGALIGSPACAAPEQPVQIPSDRPGIEVLALSRGRGVPEATQAAFQLIAARVKAARESGQVIAIEQFAIGLEGETQLCVVFRDEAARDALGLELEKLGSGVDLLQLRQNGCSRQ